MYAGEGLIVAIFSPRAAGQVGLICDGATQDF